MKLKNYLILSILVFTASPFAVAQPFQSDYSKLVMKGNQAYEAGEFESAKTAFKDALLLKPEGVEAQKNLALSLSKLEEESEAEEEYSRLLTQELDDEKRAEGLYNLSRLHLQKAQKELEAEEQDLKSVIKDASESIYYANEALKLNPENEEALNNKSQAQHILKQIAIAPPPEQQQQESEEGDGESSQSEDQQKSDEENPESENSDQQNNDESENSENQNQENQDQENQEDSQNSEQDQSEEESQQNPESHEREQQQEENEQNESDESDQGEQEEQDQQQSEAEQNEQDDQNGENGQASMNGEPIEMTPEQAEALLEMLGETQRFVLSSPRYNPDLQNQKTW